MKEGDMDIDPSSFAYVSKILANLRCAVPHVRWASNRLDAIGTLVKESWILFIAPTELSISTQEKKAELHHSSSKDCTDEQVGPNRFIVGHHRIPPTNASEQPTMNGVKIGPRINKANKAPNGSVKPVAIAISVAFIRPPPPACIGAATAMPSGMLWRAIAAMSTIPYIQERPRPWPDLLGNCEWRGRWP